MRLVEKFTPRTRPFESHLGNLHPSMFRSYLTIAARTLRKRKGTTIINVAGLAIGLAACLLIALWVQREFSFDDFHPDADRIYRLGTETKITGDVRTGPITPAPLAPMIDQTLPAAEFTTRMRFRGAQMFTHDGRGFAGQEMIVVDSTFLDVFGGFEMLHGSRDTALDGSGSLVLTATTAETIFGRRDVVGETLEYDGATWRVTGVVADVPATSHFRFDVLATRDRVAPVFRDNWTGFGFVTFVKLANDASPAAFASRLAPIADTHALSDVQDRFELPRDELTYRLFAEPLSDVHLYSDLDIQVDPSGSITSVYAFSAIGLFILLIACINFMNLATAQASERATEVGMRKTLGAARSQLAGQFLGEALLTTLAALCIALVLASLALPAFNQMAGTALDLERALTPPMLLGGLGLVVGVGLIAGSYPAFVLSRFAPARVLKASGRHTTGTNDRRLRQGLVVFQFAISIALILGTLIVWEQFDYIQTKRLGIERERVVEIKGSGELGPQQARFIDRLRTQPNVAAASASDPLFRFSSGTAFMPADDASSGAAEGLHYFVVAPGFVDVLQIDVIAGRTFDAARRADSSAVILNAAAARAFGWSPREALDHTITDSPEDPEFDVIGVVDDFHFQSMRTRVQPLVLTLSEPTSDRVTPGSVYVRLAPGAPGQDLDGIRTAWAEFASGLPFRYAYLDQTYGELHRDVQQAGRLFGLFAGLAIVIACLGLLGLATYTVQRRAKEIGIRKALGASAPQVAALLSREFMQLVVVAGLVALPVAYLAMRQWLEDFAYQTSLGLDLFAGAVLLACLVALVTIGSQAFRAARLDPATTLRSE